MQCESPAIDTRYIISGLCRIFLSYFFKETGDDSGLAIIISFERMRERKFDNGNAHYIFLESIGAACWSVEFILLVFESDSAIFFKFYPCRIGMYCAARQWYESRTNPLAGDDRVLRMSIPVQCKGDQHNDYYFAHVIRLVIATN